MDGHHKHFIFAPEYHFITSLHVTLTRFLLMVKYIYQLIK